jgi:uncharacterized protein YggU (UPF0235/DUF167 family)
VRVVVRVTTRAGVDAVDGADEAGRLRVRVRAAPAAGAANAAVLKVMAAALGVPPSSVRLVSGARGRLKVVELGGVTRQGVDTCWPRLSVAASIGNRGASHDRRRPR